LIERAASRHRRAIECDIADGVAQFVHRRVLSRPHPPDTASCRVQRANTQLTDLRRATHLIAAFIIIIVIYTFRIAESQCLP
jgi:hypothetical protein